MSWGLAAVGFGVGLLGVVAFSESAISPSTAIPISTGAGGLGVGGLAVWWSMRERMRVAETAVTSLQGSLSKLPTISQQIGRLVTDLERHMSHSAATEAHLRERLDKLRDAHHEHSIMLTRLTERYNAMRSAIVDVVPGVPRELLETPTGPVDVSGRRR